MEGQGLLAHRPSGRGERGRRRRRRGRGERGRDGCGERVCKTSLRGCLERVG